MMSPMLMSLLCCGWAVEVLEVVRVSNDMHSVKAEGGVYCRWGGREINN